MTNNYENKASAAATAGTDAPQPCLLQAEQPIHQPPPSVPPPRGPGWKVILTVLVIGATMLWIGTKWGDRLGGAASRVTGVLSRGHDHSAETTPAARYYTCSMHPWVILPKPGLCPVCHMDLVPLDPAQFTGQLEIDPLVVQNIGVRIAPVISGPLTQTIRTVGTVDYNETTVRDVNIKLSGWIEKLHADYLGQEVKQGQPLLELYSPDLYTAQQDHLLALRSAGRSGPSATQDSDSVLQATRTRLEYFDITPEQIQALEQRGQATKTMTIYSPYTGVIIKKNAFEGMRVEPGTLLYRIADLSTVWVMVTLYEYQLPYVQAGQRAVMSLPYIPGQTFEGKVIYVYPTLDEKTRQVRVRLEFPNEQGLLKPGMFAEVQLKSTLADDRILAPREAIIDTGERQVAFVSLGEGKFEPRNVQLGAQTENGMVQVLSGLKPGEMVVTSGQFLLDSESRIRESLAKMIKGETAAQQKASSAPAAAPADLVQLPPAAQQALSDVVSSYLAIGDRLAADTIEGIADPARHVAQSTEAMMHVPLPGDEHFWHKHQEVATIRGEALALAGQSDLAKARTAYADLSVALGKFLRDVGVPGTFGRTVEQLHCPMYREGQGGAMWLQAGGDVRNPYFGRKMLKCFDRRETMPAAQPPGHTVDKERGMGRESAPPNAGTASRPARPQAGIPADAMNGLVEAYLQVHGALMKDDLAAARTPVPRMVDAASSMGPEAGRSIATYASHLEHAGDITALREAVASLSDVLIPLVRQQAPTADVAPVLLHMYCPMVKKHWLQRDGEFANPYDLTMPECGVIQETIQANKG